MSVMEQAQENTEAPDVEPLNEREIAIAEGRDPDTEAEDSQPEQDAQDGGGTDAPSEWVSDEVRELAASYGLSDDELEQFSSAEEFERAAALLDRVQKPEPEEEPAEEESKDEPKDDDDILKRFEAAEYDEDTLALVQYTKSLREKQDALERDLREVMERSRQEQERAQAIAFHEAVDALGDERLGSSVDSDGSPVELSPEADKLRREIHEAATTILAGMAAKAGKDFKPPSMRVLVRRARSLAMADDLMEAGRREVREKVAAQSRKRRAVGAPRKVAPPKPTDGPVSDDDQVAQLLNDPELAKFFPDETGG